MPSNLEKQVEEEYARIVALDSKLDESRTPYLKWQLRLAQHILDDTKSYLRSVKGDTNNSYWIMFATDCLQRATEKRKWRRPSRNMAGRTKLKNTSLTSAVLL
jgi:hypothetical protein